MKETKTITRYFCDCCEAPVTDAEGNFIEGAFQEGMNAQSDIGTWCSRECFDEFTKFDK